MQIAANGADTAAAGSNAAGVILDDSGQEITLSDHADEQGGSSTTPGPELAELVSAAVGNGGTCIATSLFVLRSVNFVLFLLGDPTEKTQFHADAHSSPEPVEFSRTGDRHPVEGQSTDELNLLDSTSEKADVSNGAVEGAFYLRSFIILNDGD